MLFPRRLLARWSRRDATTRLGNHRLYRVALERQRGPVAFVLIDIDRMWEINNVYGFPGGDAVLRELGAVITTELPPGAKAFRIGGNEATILLPGEELEEARKLAEEIRARFERAGARADYMPEAFYAFTFSAGVGASLESASVALAQAKAQGRNRVVVSS